MSTSRIPTGDSPPTDHRVGPASPAINPKSLRPWPTTEIRTWPRLFARSASCRSSARASPSRGPSSRRTDIRRPSSRRIPGTSSSPSGLRSQDDRLLQQQGGSRQDLARVVGLSGPQAPGLPGALGDLGSGPQDGAPASGVDPYQLGALKPYRSLMPLAQEARKPMFFLRPADGALGGHANCLLYTSPSPRDRQKSRMPSSA